MNWCWFILKFVQFALSAIIGILFIVPYTLVPNIDAIVEGKSGPVVEFRISANDLICSKPNYDFEMADENFTNAKPDVKFPSMLDKGMVAPFEDIRMAMGCLEHYQGDKAECTCWSFEMGSTILAVTIIALISSATSLCDMASIFAAEGQDAQTTCAQGMGSCVCSLVTGLTWIVQGIIISIFVFGKWPYVYVLSNLPEYDIDIDNIAVHHFYSIPWQWHIGMVLCFSFFIVMCFEGVVYLGESGTDKQLTVHVPDVMVSEEVKVQRHSSTSSSRRSGDRPNAHHGAGPSGEQKQYGRSQRNHRSSHQSTH